MKKVLVFGDTIIDKYISLETIKISDEAPVITHSINGIKYLLGGGSNVSRNVSALGTECEYIGLSDENEKLLYDLFKENEVKAFLSRSDNSVPIKTRIMSRSQQICRFDTKNIVKPSKDVFKKVIEYFLENIDNYSSVIFSKYFDGFLTPQLVNFIAKKCKEKGIFTIIDNRQNNSLEYKNISFLKLNFNEFQNLLDKKIKDEIDPVVENLKDLYNKADYETIVVTRAEKEVVMIHQGEISILPVKKTEVNDVSGAGDTFVATVASYYDKEHLEDIVKLAILASSISIKKLGTAVVYSYELKENNYVVPLEEKLKQLKEQNKKIVLTNGVFDILHSGHIRLLEEAKSKGDFLIVGINSDRIVKQLKGESRPVNSEEDRKKVLESVKHVDYAVIFDEYNACKLLDDIKPDVYVKGGDYTLETLPEKEHVGGVEVHFVNLVPGKSTTNIIKKINEK